VARRGGPVGPLGAAMDVLAGLSCISAPAAASVAMCVNANKLAKSLTSQNPTKINTATKHTNAHTHPHKQTNTTQKENMQESEERNFVSTSS